jgi:hypothetical protein
MMGGGWIPFIGGGVTRGEAWGTRRAGCRFSLQLAVALIRNIGNNNT